MENSFLVYLAVLKRRFWVILLLLAATMAVILARAWMTPPSYRSSTVLQVIPLEPEEVTLYTRLNTVSSADTIELILFQFSTVVRSPRVAQRTLNETGVDLTAAQLVDNLAVERDPAGDLLNVSVTASSPEEAARLLQTQIAGALQEFRESRALPSEASGKFIAAELVQAETDLREARQAVLQFKLDNGVEYLDRELLAQQDAVRDLSAQQQVAEIEIKQLEAALAEVERQIATAVDAAPDAGAAAIGVPTLLAELQARRANLVVDMASRRAQMDASVALLAKRQTDLAALITLGGRYQELQDAVTERQASRDFLAGKAREAQLKASQSRSIGYLQTVVEASTPRGQIAKRTVQTALLGALLSIVAGAVLVFVLDFVERSLRHGRRVPA